MLVAAAGNTALQSVMPAIGREIGIADFWVAVAYTWSAVLWVLLAPYWARRSDHHGRKALTVTSVNRQGVTVRLHAGSGVDKDTLANALRAALEHLERSGMGLRR